MSREYILYIAITALSAILLLSGCCTYRKGYGDRTTIRSDSVHTDLRIETRIEYQTDTVYIEIPAQRAERMTTDSISFLENDFATSEAHINHDGSLFHNLNTKPQKKPVEVQTPIYHKDSVRIEYKEVEKEIPVKTERDFTLWERICLRWFPWSLLLITVLIGFRFRKQLWNFIKRLFYIICF